MTLPLTTRFKVAQDVHSRRFHEEIVLLDLARGEYFSLNEVGARVWEGLHAGGTLAEVVSSLAVDYDTDAAQFSADVVTLAEDLVGRQLLVESD